VGQAVVRNRVKRRVREAVRARLPRLRGGKDLVWIARPASATATYTEIVAAVDELLGRSRLLGNLAGAKQ
jgi:ribonuclease P protein component